MKAFTNQQMPKRIQQTLLAGLVLIVVILPFNAFLSTWGGTHIGPLWLWKSWKEILLALLGAVAAVTVLSHVSYTKAIFGDTLWRLVALYAFFVIVLSLVLVRFNLNSTSLAGFAFDLRYLVIFFVSFVLFRFGTFDKTTLFTRAVQYIVVVGAVLGLLGIAQVTVIPRDFLSQFGYEKGQTIAPFMTIDEKNPEIIRAFASLRGPNDYGAFLVLTFLLLLVLPFKNHTKLLLGMPMVLGVFLSASRSALLGLMVGVLVWAVLQYAQYIRRRHLVTAGLSLVVGACVVMALSLTVPSVRLLVFHSSPNDTHLTEGNIDSHSREIIDATNRIVDEPLGCGAGCSGPASFYGDNPQISENYYLQIAEQYGVVGLVLWLALAVVTVRRILKSKTDTYLPALVAFFVAASAIGLLLHTWADDAVSLSWWGLAGAFIGYNGSIWEKKSKNSSRSRTSLSS